MNSTDKRPSLTKRQSEIYEFLRDKILNRGYGPTVREIGNHFGIRSPNGVMCHLKALEKKGLISRESHMSRAIQLADKPSDRLSLKDAGRLNPGVPLKPSSNGDRVNFASLFDTDGHCCLKVEGSRFKSSQINDGDYLVISRYREPVNGDMVVVLVNGNDASIRRYQDQSGIARLESLDQTDSLHPSNCESFGVVVSVIRNLT